MCNMYGLDITTLIYARDDAAQQSLLKAVADIRLSQYNEQMRDIGQLASKMRVSPCCGHTTCYAVFVNPIGGGVWCFQQRTLQMTSFSPSLFLPTFFSDGPNHSALI